MGLFYATLDSSLLSKVLSHLVTFDLYVVLLSWASALVGAFLTFRLRTDHGYRLTTRNFITFCFPAEILRNRSCRLDVLFAISIRFLWPLIIVPLFISSTAITQLTHDKLAKWLGARPVWPDSMLIHVLALTGVVVVADLANFCTHFLDHKVSVLWEFHKVHHAASFLIPITNRRIHPVNELFDDTVLLFAVGVLLGAITYFAGLPIDDNVVLGMDAYFFANLLSFYHLRHSHIPMSYGPLEFILLSPAQHHLHHSCATRHWDKNFGLLFSFWDRMAGTLMRSEAPDQIILGLPAQYNGKYDRLAQLYLAPFINLLRMITRQGVRVAHSSAASSARAEPAERQQIG